MKRYEIYLPLKYNDGKGIEPEKIKQIREGLIEEFGALTVSSLSAPYQGTWKYGGVEFIDDTIKIEVITIDDENADDFFKNYKEHLAPNRTPNQIARHHRSAKLSSSSGKRRSR